MAEVNIDVAKQATSEEILSRLNNSDLFSDKDLINFCCNYYSTGYSNLSAAETEVLSLSGSGVLQTVFVRVKTATTMIKVYIDDELFLYFGNKGISTSSTYAYNICFGKVGGANGTNRVWDLSSLRNGSILTSANDIMYYFPLPIFKSSLRVYGWSTISDANNSVSVSYALKE